MMKKLILGAFLTSCAWLSGQPAEARHLEWGVDCHHFDYDKCMEHHRRCRWSEHRDRCVTKHWRKHHHHHRDYRKEYVEPHHRHHEVEHFEFRLN